MKTTIDLPAELVRELKLRALREGRKLKDSVAEILRAGLDERSSNQKKPSIVVVKDRKTGLPVIRCKKAGGRRVALTPEKVSQILGEQEAGWLDGSG